MNVELQESKIQSDVVLSSNIKAKVIVIYDRANVLNIVLSSFLLK